MSKNIASALSAADRKDLAAWKASATKVRNRSGELLVRFAGYLKDGNTAGLNAMTQAVSEVRGFHVDAFVRYILAKSGGEYMTEGHVFYAPEKSVLKYNADEQTWSIKKVDLTEEERKACASEEERKAARAKKVAAQQALLAAIPAKMGVGDWWTYAPEKAKNPYKFSSLVSALKRAKENAADLTTAEGKALTALLQVAEEYNLFN